jgi:hypothetical protein
MRVKSAKATLFVAVPFGKARQIPGRLSAVPPSAGVCFVVRWASQRGRVGPAPDLTLFRRCDWSYSDAFVSGRYCRVGPQVRKQQRTSGIPSRIFSSVRPDSLQGSSESANIPATLASSEKIHYCQ